MVGCNSIAVNINTPPDPFFTFLDKSSDHDPIHGHKFIVFTVIWHRKGDRASLPSLHNKTISMILLSVVPLLRSCLSLLPTIPSLSTAEKTRALYSFMLTEKRVENKRQEQIKKIMFFHFRTILEMVNLCTISKIWRERFIVGIFFILLLLFSFDVTETLCRWKADSQPWKVGCFGKKIKTCVGLKFRVMHGNPTP